MTTLRRPLEEQVDAIRRAVAERSGAAPGQAPGGGAAAAIERAQRNAAISAHWGLTSSAPIVGPIIVLGQRVLRIALRWYINPLVEQQNAFNDAAVAALFELELENRRLRQTLAARSPRESEESGPS